MDDIIAPARAFLEKPKTDEAIKVDEGNGPRYAISSKQGWRVEIKGADVAKSKPPSPF
ncbi:hypothetical protein MN116_001577 [Schistosoma mekongi]|uniref:Uncharacterized protein n=1 Tax=Schistosoma mekongi TaxID=38744 RepID=A0AAE1ZIC9_SCHME|nr:hypothetical protein MN116_001577 [Schistosoma mekongi]